jgi:type VI protein secretion system component Hcp
MKTITSTRFASAAIIAFLFTIIFTANSFAAMDYFLRLEGLKGEGVYQATIDPATGDCVVKGVPAGTYTASIVCSPEYFASLGKTGGQTIEISSFSWGASNSSSIGSGTGAGRGKVNVSDFSIMKSTDKASPKLSNGVAAQPSSGGFTGKSCPLSVRKAGSDHQEYYTVTLTKVAISGGGEELPKESMERTAGGASTHYDVKANVKM